MKQVHGNSLIIGATAVAILTAGPAWAQTTTITEVQLNPIEGGINLILKTSSGSDRPQIFTTKRGKASVADIINAQLRLPQGNSFRQENPAPGIALIEATQLDANSVRITVTGSDDAPTSQPVMRKDNGLTLSFTPTTSNTTASAAPTTPTTPATASPTSSSKKPDVLVPNPQVSIDGQPAQPAGPGQPYNAAPPFLPRAVAPPVGDIAVSNIDTTPNNIDLGTQERVPRLVLRDAPVREVLSLLARAAGMNLAYAGSETATPNQQLGTIPGQQNAANNQTISLDIENEPVQDVFNYVLRLSGLEANRSGRTIFVAPKLPNSTRDVVMRNLRLNQVTVGSALNFLVGLGAESAVSRERQVVSVSAVPVGPTAAAPITQTQTTTETRVETQRIDFKDSNPLLRGLQALGDERTNSITLVGTPKLVDIAMSQLTQLDIRRRQVVVNVKVIDVNLSGNQGYNTSFSFGVGNNYFAVDDGAATFNFGGSRPATGSEVANSVTGTPVITNPIQGDPLFDGSSTFTVPGGGSGTRRVIDGNVSFTPGDATFVRPIDPSTVDPTSPGLSNFTPGTPDTITTTTDATGRQTTTFSAGSRATAEFSLPSLYRFPKRFLANLQAQVTSGNAKILTDPTLIVQEGQTASVQLTQEVVGNFKREITDTAGSSRETVTVEKTNVGLTLGVKIDRVDDNGFVSLSVAPVVRAPAGQETIENAGRVVLVSERSLQSGLIRLRDGQTLILSGIIQDQDRTTVSKIPILGDIPLLGSLFRSTNRENVRREVIVLLTPQVMDDSERSTYGYNYTPSPQVRQILERRGLQVPRRP
ncbi:MAG TPA: AMIN domain-containing protein [Nostocaceae cyanobacterium]|nr:AMIN domain-containing protein [Nostocaceae cyanobacterium]